MILLSFCSSLKRKRSQIIASIVDNNFVKLPVVCVCGGGGVFFPNVVVLLLVRRNSKYDKF